MALASNGKCPIFEASATGPSITSCVKAKSSTKKSSKQSGDLSGFMLDTCQPKNIEPYPKINSLQGVQKMDMMV
jgi:hypothetical protein